METKAIVISAEGEFAVVETDRKSACDGCHKRQDGGSCAMCTLMGDKAALRSRARNPIGAAPGDEVLVESPSGRMLGYGALVFLMPLGLGLLFYFLGGLLPWGAAAKYICSLVGFVGAFVFLWFYSRRVIARRCDVTITQILSRHGGNQPPCDEANAQD